MRFYRDTKNGLSDFDYFADLDLQFLFEPSRVKGKGGNGILVLFRNLALFHRTHLLILHTHTIQIIVDVLQLYNKEFRTPSLCYAAKDN